MNAFKSKDHNIVFHRGKRHCRGHRTVWIDWGMRFKACNLIAFTRITFEEVLNIPWAFKEIRRYYKANAWWTHEWKSRCQRRTKALISWFLLLTEAFLYRFPSLSCCNARFRFNLYEILYQLESVLVYVCFGRVASVSHVKLNAIHLSGKTNYRKSLGSMCNLLFIYEIYSLHKTQ